MEGQDNDGNFPVAQSVLASIHTCYFKRVKHYKDNIDWLKIEDENAENLISLALSQYDEEALRGTCGPISAFLTAEKPRATTLRAVILDLLEVPDRKGAFFRVVWEHIRDRVNLAMKTGCILLLTTLAMASGQMEEARELASIARSMNFDGAETACKAFLDTSLTFRLKRDVSIELTIILLFLATVLLKGRDEEAPALVARAKRGLKKLGLGTATELKHSRYWSLRICGFDRSNEIEDARKFCEGVITKHMHLMSIEVALRQKDDGQAKANLERAQKQSYKKHRPLSILAAFTATVAKDFREARSSINRTIAEASTQDDNILLSLSCLYIAAGIKMHADSYTTARELYHKILEDCKVLSELPYNARSKRALGEIALLEGDEGSARKNFEEVVSLCKEMGIPPTNLYRDNYYLHLESRFTGWKNFLDTSS
ncbi:hypothetical protein DXG01_010812 [Tephrocybe rancida]|nr:hypothetical protein DXG01_010812 [Tephrocybe rancida]